MKRRKAITNTRIIIRIRKNTNEAKDNKKKKKNTKTKIKTDIDKYRGIRNKRNMNEKEKAMSSVVEKPKKTQFIVNDVTLEALVELHNENPNGIGVLKDELAGFFKDMNKYTPSLLSDWSLGVCDAHNDLLAIGPCVCADLCDAALLRELL